MEQVLSERLIVDRLERHFQDLGYLTARELSAGYGIADLVVFAIDNNRCRVRFANKQYRPLERVEHYSLLRMIPEVNSGASASLATLSAGLPFSPSYLRRELLGFLLRFGYITEVGDRRYAKVNGFVPITDEIVAIEAKISNWKKGAIQAKRYQVFANRVFLALSSEYVHRVDCSVLTRHGIGLLRVDEGVWEELPAPRLSPKDEDRHDLMSEWIWRHKRAELEEVIGDAQG